MESRVEVSIRDQHTHNQATRTHERGAIKWPTLPLVEVALPNDDMLSHGPSGWLPAYGPLLYRLVVAANILCCFGMCLTY